MWEPQRRRERGSGSLLKGRGAHGQKLTTLWSQHTTSECHYSDHRRVSLTGGTTIIDVYAPNTGAGGGGDAGTLRESRELQPGQALGSILSTEKDNRNEL